MICLFRCAWPFRSFRWAHRLGWPIRGKQTCSDCGIAFPALVKFPVAKQFKVRKAGKRVTVIAARKAANG